MQVSIITINYNSSLFTIKLVESIFKNVSELTASLDSIENKNLRFESLIYDKENGIVGCIHAGWKGAIADIIKKTIIAIKKFYFKTCE